MNTINPGDLVRFASDRACCERVARPLAGHYFTVSKIDVIPVQCVHCGWSDTVRRAMFNEKTPGGRTCYAPVGWLKKVPPLRDSEAADAIMEAPILRVLEAA